MVNNNNINGNKSSKNISSKNTRLVSPSSPSTQPPLKKQKVAPTQQGGLSFVQKTIFPYIQQEFQKKGLKLVPSDIKQDSNHKLQTNNDHISLKIFHDLQKTIQNNNQYIPTKIEQASKDFDVKFYETLLLAFTNEFTKKTKHPNYKL